MVTRIARWWPWDLPSAGQEQEDAIAVVTAAGDARLTPPELATPSQLQKRPLIVLSDLA